MGRPKGSCKDQIKFPEFVERDGKRYQILIKFCHESGKPRRYLKHLANHGGIDSICADYDSCKRVYICVDETERIKQMESRTSYRAREFIEEDGKVYQIRERYCEDNNISLDAVKFRLRHMSKNPKYHLEGKRIETPYENLWYVFIGFKKSGARREYLRKRGKELGCGKKRNKKVEKELDRMMEDSEDD